MIKPNRGCLRCRTSDAQVAFAESTVRHYAHVLAKKPSVTRDELEQLSQLKQEVAARRQELTSHLSECTA